MDLETSRTEPTNEPPKVAPAHVGDTLGIMCQIGIAAICQRYGESLFFLPTLYVSQAIIQSLLPIFAIVRVFSAIVFGSILFAGQGWSICTYVWAIGAVIATIVLLPPSAFLSRQEVVSRIVPTTLGFALVDAMIAIAVAVGPNGGSSRFVFSNSMDLLSFRTWGSILSLNRSKTFGYTCAPRCAKAQNQNTNSASLSPMVKQ